MGGSIQFVVAPGEASAGERLHHIAIQATAVLLQPWFEEEEPPPERAPGMVGALMDELLRPRSAEPAAS